MYRLFCLFFIFRGGCGTRVKKAALRSSRKLPLLQRRFSTFCSSQIHRILRYAVLYWNRLEKMCRKIMNIQVSILFGLSCVYLFADASLSSQCQSLKTCANNTRYGVNGCYSYLTRLTSYPATEATWTTFWNNICNNKATTIACNGVTRNSCNDRRTKAEYDEAVEMINTMCSDDGKEYYRRIYNEESNCLGNTTIAYMVKTKRKTCKDDYIETRTSTMTATQVCNLAKQSRNCIMNYAAGLCSNLSKWVLDKGWIAYVHYFFAACHSTFVSEKYALPPEPSAGRK
ncbi:hypothetical protein PoB_000379400 [Plakobranchus ocellatus]|uniref:DUF19 domain-containing protein n=1 Tax=Plakobranchus ocellatus TaxID=259542 RepID=A0AAV3Y5C5_9GAST|nr:hypothetical protein PoB_000379400 [Plakobranchus ocellatus]